MNSIQEQFEDLQRRHPSAILEPYNGGHIVKIPKYRLPTVWSVRDSLETVVTVVFALPHFFPTVCPNNFWTEEICRLENGRIPERSNECNKIKAMEVKLALGSAGN